MSVVGQSPPAAPALTGRVHSLDVLRGFALLGMIVVHFHMRSTEVPGWEEIIRTLVWRLVETKSHGTFALLFGAGFALQLQRAESRAAPFVTIYLRRLAVLAVFGFAAHAFFGFNVLLGYAVWGVALLVMRRWSTRPLIVTATLSAASVSLYQVLTVGFDLATVGRAGAQAAVQANQAIAATINAALRAAEAQPDYGVLLLARLRHMAWFYTQPFSFLPGATLTLFIIGLLAVRHRVFETPLEHRREILTMMAFGFLSWLTDNWLLPLWTTPLVIPAIDLHVHWLFGVVRDQWLAFTYVGGALLLLAVRPRLLQALRVFGTAGRMALTSYIAQIAILDLLFTGYALDLPPIRPRYVPIASILLFGSLAAFSTVWFRHYRFGPAEWLWRSLTYWCRQPLRH